MAEDRGPMKPWMCGAKLRGKAGRYCRRPKTKGCPRCKLHGGKSVKGADVPWFKNGERSKYMPTGWLERYDHYLESKDVTMERELALAGVLLDEALLAVKEAAPISMMVDVRKKVRELRTAMTMPDADPKDIMRLVNDLERVTSEGVATHRAKKDLTEAIEFRSRIAQREWKRQMDLGAVMTAAQAAIFIRAFQEAIQRHVTDPAAITRIIAHIAPAVNAGNVRTPGIEGPGHPAGS